VRQLLHERKFDVEYRMSHRTWKKLHRILKPKLRRLNSRNPDRNRPITVDMIMSAGIRRLAGGQVRNIRHIIGMSSPEAYNSIDKFIKSINESPELDINLPETAEEWERIRKGFTSKSSNRLMQGCVGAIDGFLALITAPFRKEGINIRAYYSGHNECYGLNCQAACDARLRFLYFGRLHNFIIENDLKSDTDGDFEEDTEDAQIIAMPNAPMGMVYLPVMPDPDDEWNSVPGTSVVRSGIVEEIFRQGITRPISNRRRNQQVLNQENDDEDHNLHLDNQEFFHPF
jgi:hypothetical protein